MILDTSSLVSVERGAATWRELIRPTDDVAIAAVTAAELLLGVELADEQHRAGRQEYVDGILSVLEVESYDLAAARVHAALLAHVRRSGRPRGAYDLIIAATALSKDRTVVTQDPSGFQDLPGVMVRPMH